MKVVYTERHLLHNPETEVQFGIPIPMFEIPERAETIRATLDQDENFLFHEPTVYGLDHITAVHDEGLVRYMEEAWTDWQKAFQQAPAAIPDTMLHPALREGMGPAPEPKGAIGRLGYWCWETMTPLVPGSYAAARAAVDVALTTADLVLGGEPSAYGLTRPPGHHCPRSAFGGYGLFNMAAVAANYLARHAGEPVAILDVDYHHGNGTQQIFYQRSDILYCSLHGHPDRAFPYFVGWEEEAGAGDGDGYNVNIPLHAGCTDEEYLEALEGVLDRISGLAGSLMVVSLGFDTYGQDPIADFALTTPVYHEVGKRAAAVGKRLVIIQEGGYHVPQLGENARQWLRGAEGRPLDLHPGGR